MMAAMNLQRCQRIVAYLIGGFVMLGSSATALADESVHLTLVHEQGLETDEFEGGDIAPLVRPCGNVGFLYVSRTDDPAGRWYLHRLADGSLMDVGLPYNAVWPIECSVDGRWATTSRYVDTGPDRLVSLVEPSADELLTLSDGLMYWSNAEDAAILVIDWAGRDGGIVYPHSLEGLEVFAAQAAPGSIAAGPVWIDSERIILALSSERSINLVELPADAIRFDAGKSAESWFDLGGILSSGHGGSLLQKVNRSDAEAIDLQSTGGALLVHQFPVPVWANRLFCTKETEWECDRVSVEPMADIVRVFYPKMTLLDATGRLLWIENRAGEFCAAVAQSNSDLGNCTHESPLDMFEEIWWNGVTPDRRHMFIIGRKAYDDDPVIAVFELTIVPSE